MTETSANVADLRTFVNGGELIVSGLGSTYTSVVTAANTVLAACQDFQPSTFALAGCNAMLTNMAINNGYVATVADAVEAADHHDGTVTVSDSGIAFALTAHGLFDRPPVVAVENMELYGIAPTSGFSDDPICAANGNFVHGDDDVRLPGFAGGLSVMRIYNSLAHRQRGSFGWGWSSILDVALHGEDEDSVRVALADGATVAFTRHDDGSYGPNRRRNLRLTSTSEGWLLAEGFTKSWRFDGSGQLAGFTNGQAKATVHRSRQDIRPSPIRPHAVAIGRNRPPPRWAGRRSRASLPPTRRSGQRRRSCG
jgi:Domain of unknown function (DUF6531)